MPFQINQQVSFSEGIANICRLVGFPVPPDPAGSGDPAVIQMGVALNQAAAELYALRDWQELRYQMTIQVVADFAGQQEKGFPLPEDYGRFVDVTQWAQNLQWPGIGPISPQSWMSFLVNKMLPASSLYWQVRNDKLFFLLPPFPVAEPFVAYYISRGWIMDQDNPLLLKNIATKNGDMFVLDGLLISLFGRLKWLEYKGFDTSAAARDYQVQFDSRAGNDEGAMVYNLSSRGGIPLLGMRNISDTGFGE